MPGTKVEVKESKNGWTQLKDGNYVMSKFLKQGDNFFSYLFFIGVLYGKKKEQEKQNLCGYFSNER